MPPSNQPPVAHALECAARGWAVSPAGENKIPRTPNGHKAASTDPQSIRAMWAQYGGPLVGIRTGEASDLAVLDIDRQHDGQAWWLANRHLLPITRARRAAKALQARAEWLERRRETDAVLRKHHRREAAHSRRLAALILRGAE